VKEADRPVSGSVFRTTSRVEVLEFLCLGEVDPPVDEPNQPTVRSNSTVPSISRVPFRERIFIADLFQQVSELLRAARCGGRRVALHDAPEAISSGVGVLDDDAASEAASSGVGVLDAELVEISCSASTASRL